MASTPTPFKIAVAEDELSWITDRVKTARLVPDKSLPADKKWAYGVPHDVAAHLQHYWATEYDWRSVEAQLNKELQMFTLPISQDGENLTIQFVHHRSNAPDAIPLIFLHGWPGNFLEVRPIIHELTRPSASGLQAYHVVAPSLPGFGFSSYPKRPFNLSQQAAVMHKLMLALGYNRYMCQGGDWGSVLSRTMALQHGNDGCVGIHINMMGVGPPNVMRAPVAMARLVFGFVTGIWSNEYEAKLLKRLKWWMDDESGYSAIQGTKPLTIGTALADSPVGMMLWIRDKLQPLAEDDFVWEDELVITWAMLYILNGTAGHAEMYKWMVGDGLKEHTTKLFATPIGKHVPVGVSIFPREVIYAPRWWAEATAADNITFWKNHETGGHFASVEKPRELIADIREYTAVSKVALKIKGRGVQ